MENIVAIFLLCLYTMAGLFVLAIVATIIKGLADGWSEGAREYRKAKGIQ